MSRRFVSHHATIPSQTAIKISHSYAGIFSAGVSHQDDYF
jgi:hypothetical protein